mmetsp:Transcript_85578/g.266101  ORF Transcript_85578/g.266101 Transcript_85578/m.266101 type:complete len:392 (-) Transcript_85578:276-1451(-)
MGRRGGCGLSASLQSRLDHQLHLDQLLWTHLVNLQRCQHAALLRHQVGKLLWCQGAGCTGLRRARQRRHGRQRRAWSQRPARRSQRRRRPRPALGRGPAAQLVEGGKRRDPLPVHSRRRGPRRRLGGLPVEAHEVVSGAVQHRLTQLVTDGWCPPLDGLDAPWWAWSCGRGLLSRLRHRRLGRGDGLDVLRLGEAGFWRVRAASICCCVSSLFARGRVNAAAEVQVDQALGVGSGARQNLVADGAKVGCPLCPTVVALRSGGRIGAACTSIGRVAGATKRRRGHCHCWAAPVVGEEVADGDRRARRRGLLPRRRRSLRLCLRRLGLRLGLRRLLYQPTLLSVLQLEKLSQRLQIAAVRLGVRLPVQAAKPLPGGSLVPAALEGGDLCRAPV